MKASISSRAFLLAAAAVCAVAVSGTNTQPAAAQTPAGYHVLRRIPIGGEGGWDFLTIDTATNRLFITRGNRVQVMDLKTSRIVGEIQGTNGVHGVAVNPANHHIYTSNGRDTSVSIIDAVTLTPQKTIRTTGANPDAILFEPVSRRIFTFNGRGNNATAIDAVTDTVVGTVELGGKPEVAVADGAGHVFVNLEDRSAVAEFDARTLELLHTYPVAPCESPTGLAMDQERRELFLGCDSRMMGIVDARTGRVMATPPSGSGTDGTAFDPGTRFAFSSNGEGTLTLVRQTGPNTFTSGNIPTERGARTLALDPRTHLVYLITARFNPAPPATADQPHPRPSMVPGSAVILVVGRR